MKLMVRYDEDRQFLELDIQEMKRLWINLSIEDGDYTQEEMEEILQRKFDEEFNRPEYNGWHRAQRHSVQPTSRLDDPDGMTGDEPSMADVVDDRIFREDMIRIEYEEDYEDVCKKIHSILGMKNHWIDAVIAVRLDGMRINDYAASIGKDPNVVTQWLKRAEKIIRKFYEKRQI